MYITYKERVYGKEQVYGSLQDMMNTHTHARTHAHTHTHTQWNVDHAIKDGKLYVQKMAAVLNKRGVKKVKVAIAKAAVERSALPPPKAPASRGEYVCRIEVSKNGRGGKTVTMVSGLGLLPVDAKKELLKILKNAVAGGGYYL